MDSKDNWIKIDQEKKQKPICINGISSNLCSSIQGKDCPCLIHEKWLKSQLNQDMGEVIAFHPAWINEDFNPNGIRVGFVNGDGNFFSAEWNDHQDTYQNNEQHFPTHWQPLPEPPKP